MRSGVPLSLLLLCLAGCVTPAKVNDAVSSTAGAVTALRPAAAPATPAARPAPAPEPMAGSETTGNRSAVTVSSSGPTLTVQALFQKSNVTGTDLAGQLVLMRTLLRDRRSADAVGALLGPADKSAAASGLNPQAELLRAAMGQAQKLIDPYVASIGFGALDLHLKTLTEDPALLSGERITLPSQRSMTLAQMQRVVNMAAIVVATRVTSRVLRQAVVDFANVEADYIKLIERREAAATVLYEVLLKGAGSPAALGDDFADDDLRYLRETVRGQSIKDFANDLGAQNLALRYLRRTDPAGYADYKARSDGLQSRTKGYIRSVAGVTAFAALLATFGQQTIGAVQKNKGEDIFMALPFAWEFVKEVPPVLKASWEVGAAGIVELPMKASKRFRVGGVEKSTDVAKSGDVFSAMKQYQAQPIFEEALFRSGADGLLYKLYRCDRSEVGRMIDVAVPISEREKFARRVVPDNATRFAFANAFSPQAVNPVEQSLGDELLRNDHRTRSSATQGVAYGELQRDVTRGYAKWNSDQLLRLILANREGVAAHATLQLGEMRVRPVPSMQSVYAYESLIDECSQQFGGGPRAAAAPTSRPPAKPAPATPNKPTK